MVVSPRQIRAARALLDWDQRDLAAAIGLSINEISRIERSQVSPRVSTLERIARALEAAGIEFIERGVRLSDRIPLQ